MHLNLEEKISAASDAHVDVMAMKIGIKCFNDEKTNELIASLKKSAQCLPAELRTLRNQLFAAANNIDCLRNWRDAVEEECIVAEIGWTENAKESLSRLINWHVTVALDPQVSNAAKALIQRGRTEADADLRGSD